VAFRSTFFASCALLAVSSAWAPAAFAQPAAGSEEADAINEGDIIVTARRRDETAQNTPVPLTVLNDTLLDRYGVRGVATIAQLTPGLFTGESSGAMGGSISLRGVGSGESMAFIDQAVSVNVDGVPISSAQILRAAQMDLKQIEVLRGPQSLFFGKNSPGGIISLTTADPGKDVEVLARAGYEFTAREKYADVTFSAPLSDTIGARLAAHYSKSSGYFRLFTPTGLGVTPSDESRFPAQEEFFLRGSLAFKPSDRLSLRLKGTFTNNDTIGGSSYFSDIVACPYGVSQRPGEGAGNCQNDGVLYTAQLPASFMALSPYLENPNGNRTNKQLLLTAALDWELSDQLKLSSVTGYYNVRERLTSNGGYGPYSNNGFAVRFRNDQISQELRLASSFDGPLNFLVGGFFEHRKLFTLTMIGVPYGGTLAAPPTAPLNLRLPIESTHQEQDSYSAFGQLLFNPTDQIQITAGGRYTHEVKTLLDYTIVVGTASGYGAGVDVTKLADYPGTPTPKLKFNNFSPEVTISYKPMTDMMLFASWKRGFKSGGFDAGYVNGALLGTSAAAVARRAAGQTFAPEKVNGFEAGLKSTLFDRQLTFNLTGYWYDYDGLQVSVFDTTARAFRIQNAAKARVKGIEVELSYRPQAIPGLNLHANMAFNDAKYRNYLSDCYAGQTQALGCNTGPLNGVNFTAQDLSGRRLRKAPVFNATFGGYYEAAVNDAWMFSLSADANVSSAYNVGTQLQPIARQGAYTKFDATFRLFTENKRWEFAVIGRNLGNVRNLINGIDRTGTGGAKGTNGVSCTGIGTPVGCVATADLIGTPATPRTVALQLTYRY